MEKFDGGVMASVEECRDVTQNMYLRRLKKFCLEKAKTGKENRVELEGLKWIGSWIGMSGRVNRANINGLVKAIKTAKPNTDIEFYVQWK